MNTMVMSVEATSKTCTTKTPFAKLKLTLQASFEKKKKGKPCGNEGYSSIKSTLSELHMSRLKIFLVSST